MKRGWQEKNHRQTNLCDYELIDIDLSALRGIIPSHSTTAQSYRWKTLFLKSCFSPVRFVVKGKQLSRRKRKEQKMKGPASHNYSLKCSCTTPELHQHRIVLARHWQCLLISGRRDTNRSTIWKATEPRQVCAECWTVQSTLARCRDLSPIPNTSTYSHE